MKLLILFFFFFSFELFSGEITGKAFFKDRLIYTEKHFYELDDLGLYKKLTTEYYDNSNKVFAKISSNFEKNKVIPDYIFEDFRFLFKESVIFDESKNKVFIDKVTLGKSQKTELRVNPNAILSQGFHNFILTNFEKIILGKLEVSIVVTSKSDQYRFYVETEKAQNNRIKINITPVNFFLKAVMSPIKLEYEISSKRLLSFQGLTNIDNEKGDSQSAIITYTYR